MDRLNLYLISWNCARIPWVTSAFTEHILGGIPDSSPAPDILILSLQEAAPLSYAFLGARYLDPYIHAYVTAIQNATNTVLREDFSLVGKNNVGMTVVLVFVKDVNLDKIKYVNYAGVGCGLWSMGNKAGVGIKIGYEVPQGEGNDLDASIVELTFVGMHLAPHEWNVERRNQNWEAIVRGLVFEKEQKLQDENDLQQPLLEGDTELENTNTRSVGLYSPYSHTFLMGDLNYRTALSRPTQRDRRQFPQPSDGPNHISKLFRGDQCHLERQSNRTLHGFIEAEIRFPPSYKYKVKNGMNYDNTQWEWATNRWPSWTDRILYLPLDTRKYPKDSIVVYRYILIPEILGSDHKPVVCYLSIPAKPLSTMHDTSPGAHILLPSDIRLHSPFPIDKDWKEKRSVARAREVGVGMLAFLTTTATGLGFLIGVVGGSLALWWLLAD